MSLFEKKSLWWLSGMPAVLALTAGLIFALSSRGSSPHDLDWCRATAVAAEDSSDYKTASVCYARLLQAQPDDREIAFKLGEALWATGQPESAQSLMVRLASRESGEYQPAEIWLAREVVAGASPSPAALELAILRLTKATQISPDDQEANFWLAIAQARSNHWDAVDPPAEKVGERLTELSQRLSAIGTEQGNAVAAKRWNQAR